MPLAPGMPLLDDEQSDERALDVRTALGPWPAGAGVRLPGEEVCFVVSPRVWVAPGPLVIAIASATLVLGLVVSATRPSALLGLVPLLLAVAEAARSAWWRRARYVVTTARVLALRPFTRPREVSRTRARLEDDRTPEAIVAGSTTLTLDGLDPLQVAALADALDAPRATGTTRGVRRTRVRRVAVA